MKLTSFISALLGIPDKKCFGADIVENNITSIPFSLIDYEKKQPLDYKKDTFSLITLLQTLHHVKYLEKLLLDISRVMLKDGILLIREHDIKNDNMKNIIDIQHLIYNIINKETDNCIYTSYKTADMWDDILIRYNFYPVMRSNPRGCTSSYYSIYVYKPV